MSTYTHTHAWMEISTAPILYIHSWYSTDISALNISWYVPPALQAPTQSYTFSHSISLSVSLLLTRSRDSAQDRAYQFSSLWFSLMNASLSHARPRTHTPRQQKPVADAPSHTHPTIHPYFHRPSCAAIHPPLSVFYPFDTLYVVLCCVFAAAFQTRRERSEHTASIRSPFVLYTCHDDDYWLVIIYAPACCSPFASAIIGARKHQAAVLQFDHSFFTK